jgi:hypothetical protein
MSGIDNRYVNHDYKGAREQRGHLFTGSMFWLIAILSSFLSLISITCYGAIENLDEMARRNARLPSTTFGHQHLEDPNNSYIWQPATLCYTDVATGHEVWRLTDADIADSFPDISWPQWSADGKWIAFTSNRTTGANPSGHILSSGLRMVQKADGSLLRPVLNGPSTSAAHAEYLHWSPVVPDVYYAFGRNYAYEGLNAYDLYKMTLTDTGGSKKLLLRFPSTKGELALKKSISSDGTTVIATDWWGESWWFPAVVYPDAEARLLDPDGHSSNRPFDDHWGSTGTRWLDNNRYHDQFLTGVGDDIWFIIMPSHTSGTWWRTRPTGSHSDGGSTHVQDRTAPYNWGNELEPANTVLTHVNSAPDPWCDDGDAATHCSSYWSHFTPDRWGRFGIYSNVSVSNIGPGLYDMKAKKHGVESFGNGLGAQHHDWHAWSDWSTSSTGPSDYSTQEITIQNWRNQGSLEVINSAHIELTDNYNALPRPTQSPDGTKVVWHSTFLSSSASTPDIFYTVAYYPYPPQITGANALNGTVTLTVDWGLTSLSPRGYTIRKWPNEATDLPPPPREVIKFRLWRSADGVNWVALNLVDHDIFARYDFSTGTFNGSSQWQLTDRPGQGNWHYAVTSLEHSGLESRVLSNVWYVELDADGAIISQGESRVYPADPGGISTITTKRPPAPTLTSAARDATVASHYNLTWSEPPDHYDIIRYYNIYYSNTGTPDPVQQNRIASVPKGTNEFVDWNAHPSLTGYYRITSVDKQGNEGTLPPPEPPAHAF